MKPELQGISADLRLATPGSTTAAILKVGHDIFEGIKLLNGKGHLAIDQCAIWFTPLYYSEALPSVQKRGHEYT